MQDQIHHLDSLSNTVLSLPDCTVNDAAQPLSDTQHTDEHGQTPMDEDMNEENNADAATHLGTDEPDWHLGRLRRKNEKTLGNQVSWMVHMGQGVHVGKLVNPYEQWLAQLLGR